MLKVYLVYVYKGNSKIMFNTYFIENLLSFSLSQHFKHAAQSIS